MMERSAETMTSVDNQTSVRKIKGKGEVIRF